MSAVPGRPKILLAEDEEHIAKLVAFKLEREGFDVRVAPNGEEALRMLAEGGWTLVILDVMMPLIDGWEVLRRTRESPATATLPVLMLTAKGGRKDMASAAELGATRYLRKPFDPSELAKVVREMSDAGGERK